MSPEQRFETKRIDHLGILAGICHEIGLIEAVNQAVDLLIAPDLAAEDFNDDPLGRSLDQVFEVGVTAKAISRLPASTAVSASAGWWSTHP